MHAVTAVTVCVLSASVGYTYWRLGRHELISLFLVGSCVIVAVPFCVMVAYIETRITPTDDEGRDFDPGPSTCSYWLTG